ncbi:MBOAT family O-acyltransferase [Bacteroidota bacterium]
MLESGILYKIFAYHKESPLFFNSIYFWIFFTLVFAVFSIFYRNKILRNTYLFIISLFFYYKSGGFFFFLLIISTLVDYSVGLKIHNTYSNFKRKLWLVVSLFVNLGMLGYYKYAEFIVRSINDVFKTDLLAYDIFASFSNVLFNSNFNTTDIFLPIGISFFTFQTISYTVDVYRNKVDPVRNILDFGFYVSFFPQLVSGPIVRASEFVPQLYKDYKISANQAGHAFFLILKGLIKKIAVADFIAVNFIDRVFESPTSFTGIENLLSVYAYSLQIYCDFSGYTDIAIGVGLLFGFRLPVNFNSPYKASGLRDFWRRWHISLSRWLRDYLYVPLGGNRKGSFRTNINLMITMLLGGLWHGAHIRFIIWGGIHGLGLVIGRMFRNSFNNTIRKNKFIKVISVIFTFHLVTLAWIFFRAHNIDAALAMFYQMFNQFNASFLLEFAAANQLILIVLIIGFVIHWLPAWIKERYRGWFVNQNLVVQGIISVIIVFLLYQVHTSEIQPFIYFQF